MEKETDALKLSLWQKLWRDRVRWCYLVGGSVGVLLLSLFGQLWSADRGNLVLTLGMLLLIAGSGFLFYRGWKTTRQEKVVIVGAEKAVGNVNSLNIYARKDERTGQIYPQKITFEWVENPTGQPWQCLNNGNWYFLHIWDIVSERLMPFILPDSQYFDPAEFANVISMPAHKKLFARRATMFQKIGPWIMIAAFIISIFGLLVMGD